MKKFIGLCPGTHLALLAHIGTVLTLAVGPLSGSASAELLVPISSSDTIVTTSIDDSVFGSFNIGFAFPFYGSAGETTVNISSNGNLQFGTFYSQYSNQAFPDSGFAQIAPFWDDLELPPGDLRYNNSTPGQFVAIWNGVKHFSSSIASLVTCQVILLDTSNSFGRPAGTIIFSYDTIGSGNSPTIGLNKGDGSTAATLYPLVGSADGSLTNDQAMSLGGHSFAFTPDGNGNYTVSDYTPATVPEIDPATGSSALSLVAGVLAMIEQRRRRATLVA
jgi:hypothetical protein